MPLERVPSQPDATPKPARPFDLHGLRPEVKTQAEQQKEDSLADLREFLDKLEHSKLSDTVKKVIRAEIRASVVRQGLPATEAYDKRPNQGSETLLTLSESWMDSYLMSHAQMKERYDRGEIDAVSLYKMILHNALLKASQTATGKEASDLREAQNELDQFLSLPEAVSFGAIDETARIAKIGKDVKELRTIAEKIIVENNFEKGPFVLEINGYRFEITNSLAGIAIEVTKDAKKVHVVLPSTGGVSMRMGARTTTPKALDDAQPPVNTQSPAAISEKSADQTEDADFLGSYRPGDDIHPAVTERPEIISPKLDQFVSLLHQLQYAKDAEAREF